VGLAWFRKRRTCSTWLQRARIVHAVKTYRAIVANKTLDTVKPRDWARCAQNVPLLTLGGYLIFANDIANSHANYYHSTRAIEFHHASADATATPAAKFCSH
jgi:hypothetical protein